jgi:hypothetical protein
MPYSKTSLIQFLQVKINVKLRIVKNKTINVNFKIKKNKKIRSFFLQFIKEAQRQILKIKI